MNTDHEIPQYAVIAQPKGSLTDERNRPVIMLGLQITTSATFHQYYLCDASDNFQEVAKRLHDKICQAGREARRAQSGLVVVEGGSDALRTEKQGGKFSGPRGEGA